VIPPRPCAIRTMRPLNRLRLALVHACLFIASAAAAQAAMDAETVRHISLTRVVANVEEAAIVLTPFPPGGKPLPTPFSRDVWYGRIARRLPGDDPGKAHTIPFAVEYRNGLAQRAVVDLNLDGALADEAPRPMNEYPPIPGARSCLTEISWNPGRDWNGRVSWTVRLVFEGETNRFAGPVCRIQKVYGMVGELAFDGAEKAVLLVDGNGNGRYSGDDFGDGLYIDRDGDRHFVIDEFAGSFVPLGAPARVGAHRFEVTSVTPDGSEVELSDTPVSSPADTLVVGQPAPDFSVRGRDGRPLSLSSYRGHVTALCFAASWCSDCGRQLPVYDSIFHRYHARGFDVCVVLYDLKPEDGEAFVRRFNGSWRIYAPGKLLFENPVGLQYRADHPGVGFLIDPKGNLLGSFDEPEELEAALARYYASASR